MKIAVVHHDSHSRVLARRGRPNPEPLDPQIRKSVVDALRKHGHQVMEMRGDGRLPGRLAMFLDLDMRRHGALDQDAGAEDSPAQLPGLVFDLAYGIQGQARYTHVPAILELLGVPYVGSDPAGHAVALDKGLTRTVLEADGVPVPGGKLVRPDESVPTDLQVPAVVKPCHESGSVGLSVVRDRAAMEEAVQEIHERFEEPALVEQYVPGREIYVGVMGNDPTVSLPLVECEFAEGPGGTPSAPSDPDAPRVFNQEQKYGAREQFRMVCPVAGLPKDVHLEAQEIARRAVRAVGVRDLARVDMRVDEAGQPYVLEVNSIPGLLPDGPFALAARQAGLAFDELIEQLVQIAARRETAPKRRPSRRRAEIASVRSEEPSATQQEIERVLAQVEAPAWVDDALNAKVDDALAANKGVGEEV